MEGIFQYCRQNYLRDSITQLILFVNQNLIINLVGKLNREEIGIPACSDVTANSKKYKLSINVIKIGVVKFLVISLQLYLRFNKDVIKSIKIPISYKIGW
jgi:hypothetical protein